MKKIRITSIATVIALLIYLVLCGIFALRPVPPGPTSTSSGTLYFALDRPMEEVLAECADHLRREYGPDITVDVEETALSYAFSFPTPYGHNDVTDTITLGEDVRYGQVTCKLTNNLVVKERSAPVLLAPVHYLILRSKKDRSQSVTQDLIRELTTSSNKEDAHDVQ